MYSVVRPSDIAAPGDHVPSSSILLLETDAKAEEAISAVLLSINQRSFCHVTEKPDRTAKNLMFLRLTYLPTKLN